MNSSVFIKGHNGKYVCSENGNKPIICNREIPQAWEKFEIIKIDNDHVALKCMGKYVSSENGQKPMMCNRPEIYAWEIFLFIKHPNGFFSFRGNNGKYVTDGNGERAMTCQAEDIKAWELFTLVPADSAIGESSKQHQQKQMNATAIHLSPPSKLENYDVFKVIRNPDKSFAVTHKGQTYDAIKYVYDAIKYVNMSKNIANAIHNVAAPTKSLFDLAEKAKNVGKIAGQIAAVAGIFGAVIAFIPQNDPLMTKMNEIHKDMLKGFESLEKKINEVKFHITAESYHTNVTSEINFIYLRYIQMLKNPTPQSLEKFKESCKNQPPLKVIGLLADKLTGHPSVLEDYFNHINYDMRKLRYFEQFVLQQVTQLTVLFISAETLTSQNGKIDTENIPDWNIFQEHTNRINKVLKEYDDKIKKDYWPESVKKVARKCIDNGNLVKKGQYNYGNHQIARNILFELNKKHD
uniref:Uncharacterized protein n=1 Tax=Panagrolaimus sp. PS1159 TaxID=55785 RepID=A0AC35FPP9_9BILA